MTAPQTLAHDAIARRIPHAGRMCLLDRLDDWDLGRIACTAISHRDFDNPLRTASGLLSPCAVEYAAQAMALHGALIGEATGGAIRPGYLASVRSVAFGRWRIDDLPGDLVVQAERQAGDAQQILYRFSVTHEGLILAAGRAAVVLNSPLAEPPKRTHD